MQWNQNGYQTGWHNPYNPHTLPIVIASMGDISDVYDGRFLCLKIRDEGISD
jgi:hypothetical protein